MEDGNETKAGEGDEPIVAFFRSMNAATRREYEQLADRDRRYGEDVRGEVRS